MEDKRFQEDRPDVADKPRCEPDGESIPDDPSFEEMEEILKEIEAINDRPEIVIRLEIQP